MKYINPFFALLLLLAVFTNNACNDPTVIGSDLLSGDELDIEFTDTVTIVSYNIAEDSIITYNPDIFTNIESFPIGNFNDPIFGQANSAAYFQPTLNITFPDFDPSYTLDSVVLILPYNAKGSYGNLAESYSLEVYQMLEEFPDTQIYSNRSFPVDRLIGQISYTPMVNDSVVIEVPGEMDSFVNVPPQLRIPLNQNFFDRDLFAIDSPYTSVVDDFEAFLKGIHVRPTSTNSGMPSFNLRAAVTGSSVQNSGIRVYYHQDTIYSEYLFPIFSDNVVTANYVHDYTSSPIGLASDFIGENATYTDSLLFLQGMSGTNFVIEIPYSENLSNKILNKAELEFPIQFLPEDNQSVFLPVEQIVVSEILDDGSLRLIDDYIFAINSVGIDDVSTLFGGVQDSDDAYRVNITTHLQDMSRGLVTEKMMITLFPKAEQAARVVLNGPGKSIKPAKLKVTFTNF